ncbi:MAG: family 16 glycosylhydrolase [Puniceicoccales bacterium]|jgi:beta-glucanase (GH16 family)|nr:family 16 glycosylhydrolase [Puniceicoccales bacterium]
MLKKLPRFSSPNPPRNFHQSPFCILAGAVSFVTALLLFVGSVATPPAAAAPERRKFVLPPAESTAPYVYWYWINNNASKEGATADIAALKKAGIGEAFIGHVVSGGIPDGKTVILSPKWWDTVEHAVREGERQGVNVSMFNGPGWSQSGGPWIKPEQSMRYIVSNTVLVKAGTSLNALPTRARGAIQDVAIIAYPAPRQPLVVTPQRISANSPKIANELTELIITGSRKNSVALGSGAYDFYFNNAANLQALTLDFGHASLEFYGEILSEDAATGNLVKLRTIKGQRTNLNSHQMGALVGTPFVFSFAPQNTKRIRVVFNRFHRTGHLRNLTFSSVPLVDSIADKQLGRMWQSPVPPSDYYQWPLQAPVKQGTAIPQNAISVLWRNPSGDSISGTVHSAFNDEKAPLNPNVLPPASLAFTAPHSGDYIVARISMASTGAVCSPTPPHATGLEVDKMSARHTKAHFDAFIGKFVKILREGDTIKRGLKHITLDSYEVGPQNWTDDFPALFSQKYGYDPLPWLASISSGIVVGTRDMTDRFLWDWRRLVADLIAKNYVGGLTFAANQHGIKTWLENYGHWGFPAESLQYGGAADEIGGEYWWPGGLGAVEIRLASSCGNTYGKKRVSAEAFTSGGNFGQTPANLKARGDWSFANGINHLVMHVYTHQPYKAFPGIVPWFGGDFNRYSTWFKDYGRAFTDYIRRASYLLQQDNHGADVAYFFGEDTPRMNGQQIPALPAGHDFDYINAEVLLNRATVQNGFLTLKHGQKYRVLALPPSETITPQLLKKITHFVRQGLVIVGTPPTRSPSLQGYPNADASIRANAAVLFGENPSTVVDRIVGKGRVFSGHTLEEIFAKIGLKKDIANLPREILWTHRTGKNCDIYFLSNQSGKRIELLPQFRVAGVRPEIWNAETGEVYEPAVYTTHADTTTVPITLENSGSIFVVFDKKKTPVASPQLVSVEFSTGANVPKKTAVTPPPSLKIIKAEYGVIGDRERSYNVTKIVRDQVNLNTLSIAATNDVLGGDPAEHVLKRLRVEYVLNGKPGVASAEEDTTLEIGTATGANPLQNRLPEFTIRHARPNEGKTLGELRLTTSTAGVYTAKFSDGTSRVWQTTHTPATVALDGAWDVVFRHPQMNTSATGPASFDPIYREQKVKFQTLQDWKDHAHPDIKYFSGTAVYTKKFNWNANHIGNANGLVLDLGKVAEVARVIVNGIDLGVVWKAPFKIDISKAVIGGENTLEIHVANLWNNRFIGDSKIPLLDSHTGNKWASWVVENWQRPLVSRVTLTSNNSRGGRSLQTSGLIGPVVLRGTITLGDGLSDNKRDGYTLFWADEFNTSGTQLPDPANWGYEHGYSIRNNELQFYTRERLKNTRVQNGILILEAHREPFGKIVNRETGKHQADYTSASVITFGKKLALHYGRLEIRAKLPRGPGIWPALWMLGTDIRNVGWPRCGEIDIMEHVWSSPGRVYATFHTGDNTTDPKTGKRRTHWSNGGAIDDEPWNGFHTYRLDWTPDEIAVYYDDILVHKYRRDPAQNPLHWPFNKPHYLLMNIALGGSWGGPPTKETAFPAQMLIDYVRAWKK